MRILFLEIDTGRHWAVASLGPAFLAGYVRRFGHEAQLYRVPPGLPAAEVVTEVLQKSPDVVGVSLTSRQWLRGKEILNALRQTSDVPTVVGGLHPTFSPQQSLREPGIDYVCLGEGEKPVLFLLESLSAGGPIKDGQIKNIWVKGGGRPQLNPPFEPIDDLPYMARDMLDERHGVMHMATQRGCPFDCTYCAARMYDELYDATGASYGRRRSHESVLDELDQIRRNGPLHYVIFLDDTFTIHHPWVRDFCRLYGRDVAVPFSLHARVETVNPKMLDELAAAGCRHITYGVESGSEDVRRRIMKRPATNAKTVEVFEWTKKAGILVTANYMIGLPGETPAQMQETLDLHDRLQPDDFGYFVFYPFPGTALFRYCQEHGYLPDDYLELPANHRQSILNLPDATKAQITEFYDRWTRVRVAHTLRRCGPNSSDEQKSLAASLIEQCAAGG